MSVDQNSPDQNSPDQTGETRNQITLNSADVSIPCVRCEGRAGTSMK